MNSIRLIVLATILLISTSIQSQQEQRDIFADPQNLNILPKDISSADLSNTMKGFAMGLGLRCESCHVGEPNTPLSTFDFSSDEKAMKKKARVMLAMVQDINSAYMGKLNAIEDTTRTQVRCVTCHRGQQQPKLIEDVLDEQLASNGIEATVDKYNELRTKFYGSHSYDFSEFSLPMYAQGLAGRKETDAAIALTRINADHFPDSYFTFFALGEFNSAAGNTNDAIENYQRAIELNPRSKPFLEKKIKSLTGGSN
jgi:tetratricopeptide (TPR) repeat protein